MAFVIRKSTVADLDAIEDIYDFARDYMAAHGNPTQWIAYPQRELIENDIAAGVSYVLEDARNVGVAGNVEDAGKVGDAGDAGDEAGAAICGVFALFEGPDPTYAVIEDGAWLNDEPYMVIHRIARAQNAHGIVDAAVRFAASFKPHMTNVRIDTHAHNLPMQRALEKLGFTRCGIIYVSDDISDHEPRIAYQKSFA